MATSVVLFVNMLILYIAVCIKLYTGYNRAGLETNTVKTFEQVFHDAYYRLAVLDPVLPIGEQQLQSTVYRSHSLCVMTQCGETAIPCTAQYVYALKLPVAS
jgi:hypothetical protein